MAIPLIIHGSLSVKLIKDISFNRNVRAQCNEEDAILWQKTTYASRIELLDLHIRFVTHINSTNKRNAKRSCIVTEHFITRSIRKINFQKEKRKKRKITPIGWKVWNKKVQRSIKTCWPSDTDCDEVRVWCVRRWKRHRHTSLTTSSANLTAHNCERKFCA